MNIIRVKLTSHDDGECQPAIDTFMTPATPVTHSGAFGDIEPPVTPATSSFVVPVSEYKWNQNVDIELPNGKKVRFVCFSI
jgi:hypothetical protein